MTDRALATAPAAASPGAGGGTAAGGATGTSWGSGAPVASFPCPDWWGADGCRHAGEGHVCLDVFGQPAVAGGSPCVAEARSAMAELFDRYRAVAG